MKDARTEILERIGAALPIISESRPAAYAAIPREYRQSASLEAAARLELLADRLRDYEAGVYSATFADLPGAIAAAMEARGKQRIVVPSGFPAEWLPANREFVRDTGLDYATLDHADGALTACAIAIAMTGSIVLTHTPAEGRRALTLIADYHLCIVRADQVVETVPEAIRELSRQKARLITTIAGPSATADIEMTRIKGVHGPRTLDVVLVR